MNGSPGQGPQASDALLVYCSNGPVPKSEFIPAAGYVADGAIRDTLFDSFIFLPNPGYLYDGSALKPLTKADWTGYIEETLYVAGHNVDALDAAAGVMAAALGRPYKASVFMTLLPAVKEVTDFGEVDGRRLNFSEARDRKAALKWMVDEHIARFGARGYQNLFLAGFYWFTERVLRDDDPGLKNILRYITEYIRSMGYITAWSPFNDIERTGAAEWREFGFDKVAMQANYFPPGNGWPNTWGIDALTNLASYVKDYGVGTNIELGGNDAEAYAMFKQYLKHGAELGTMDAFHMYYMNGTVASLGMMCASPDAYARSAYDELYRFVKGTLTASDILL